jgi:hypothetical protein
MKRTNILIGIGAFMGLVLSIGACMVAPPYGGSGAYYDGYPGNVVIHDPPLFIFPPALGFFAAIGIPYDLFYIDQRYYLHHGNNWYGSSRYNGPWGSMRYDRLPQALQKHRYDDIMRGRDREYGNYQKDRNRYQGRVFRPQRDESPNRERESRHDYRRN